MQHSPAVGPVSAKPEGARAKLALPPSCHGLRNSNSEAPRGFQILRLDQLRLVPRRCGREPQPTAILIEPGFGGVHWRANLALTDPDRTHFCGVDGHALERDELVARAMRGNGKPRCNLVAPKPFGPSV